MNFVIPMAGHGQRFKDAGYALPKMLIEAKGKTLLEWSVDSLPLEICTNLIFILLKEHDEQYHLIDFIKNKYKGPFELKFLVLEKTTRGQAETVLLAKELFDLKTDLLIFNIDTAFHSTSLKENLLRKDIDGILGTFLDQSDSVKYSFAKLNENGNVIQVEEKIRISDNALTGLYHFKNPQDFIEVATNHLNKGITSKGEYYIAPMYNDLIRAGKKFALDIVETIDVLGTPEELLTFTEIEK